jgi:AraC-like DNA-binding protein
MNVVKMSGNGVPLVRLNLIIPLLLVLEDEGGNPEGVLETFGLNRLVVQQSDMFIPAAKMYELVEAIAEASGDLYFGVHAGERLELQDWSPMAKGSRSATTVGDLLLQFSLDAQHEASSVSYVATISGKNTTFQEQRLAVPPMPPKQNDAFTVGYLLGILRLARGSNSLGKSVLARVCDPKVIPPDYMGIRLAACDNMGASITFPSEWLRLALHAPAIDETAHAEMEGRRPPESTLDAIHHVLEQHLHNRDLNADQIAKLLGVSKRTLSRKLARINTSAAREIARQRQKIAETEMQRGQRSIAAIGAMIGYPDPAVFARAFKRWTGETPSQYRKRWDKAQDTT